MAKEKEDKEKTAKEETTDFSRPEEIKKFLEQKEKKAEKKK